MQNFRDGALNFRVVTLYSGDSAFNAQQCINFGFCQAFYDLINFSNRNCLTSASAYALNFRVVTLYSGDSEIIAQQCIHFSFCLAIIH